MDSYATALLQRSKFNVTVRHTFLELEESGEAGGLSKLRLRPSRSCGDLPNIAEIDEFDQPLIAKEISTSASSSKETETPLSSTKDSTAWRDMSDDGDDDSTASASCSFIQDHHTSSSTTSQRSGSPAAKQGHPTPAARRRERRRRAATGAAQADTAKTHFVPSSSPRPALDHSSRRPPAAGSRADECKTRAAAARAEESSSKADEAGEVWLHGGLWVGAYDAETVLQASYSAIDQLSVVNLVDTFHAIGRCVDGDTVSLGNDKRLLQLVARLKVQQGLNKPRLVARALWGLGKVGAQGENISHVLAQLSATLTANAGLLASCSSQELTNSLWGLARLGSVDPRNRCHAERIVHRIIAESGTRLRSFTAQCLANSLWAIGKLGMRGHNVATFVGNCLKEMCCQRCLSNFSPQGLANSLWACARLQLSQSEDVSKFCCAVVAEVDSRRLAQFLPQELSMTIWAIAKLSGKGGNPRGGVRAASGGARPHRRCWKIHPDVEAFVIKATREAFQRLGEFSPQGLSNIGWALATMEMTRQPDVRSFLIAAASKAMSALSWYPPQAIANLCWALCRLHDAAEDGTVNMFASAVAVQSRQRMEEFEWQDLAGIVSAMKRAELVQLEEVYTFACELVTYAADSDDPAIGTQALLNIALSAARLGVDAEVLQPLAERIERLFAEGGCGAEHVNDIDRRQWSEVQTHCSSAASWADAARLARRGDYMSSREAASSEYSFFHEMDELFMARSEAVESEYSFFREKDAEFLAQSQAWANAEAWTASDAAEAWPAYELWDGSEAWMACNGVHPCQVFMAIH